MRLCRGSLAPASLVVVAALLFGAVLTAGVAQAKHAALKDEPDDEAQAAEAGSAPSAGGAATTITGEIVETHDLLSDSNGTSAPIKSGIMWTHRVVVTLSGKNHVTENWLDVRDLSGSSAFFGRKKKREQRLALPSSVKQFDSTIGANSNKAVWHVIAANKLQRLFAGQHFLMVMNLEIGDDKSGHLEAKYVKQVGFTAVVMRQATTGELANFSLPEVHSASCEIR